MAKNGDCVRVSVARSLQYFNVVQDCRFRVGSMPTKKGSAERKFTMSSGFGRSAWTLTICIPTRFPTIGIGRGRGASTAADAHDFHVNVDVLSTPNEDAVKLVPGCDVTGQVRTISIRRRDLDAVAAGTHDFDTPLMQLARRLMCIQGVKALLFGYDFVTVEKEPLADWSAIQEAAVTLVAVAARAALKDGVAMTPLQGVHAQHLRPLQPVLEKHGATVDRISELLLEKVIPNVQADGGDVQFRGFADGVVWVSMVGACASCSSSTVTVRFMIKNLLTHYIEEVTDVRAIGEDEEVPLPLNPKP